MAVETALSASAELAQEDASADRGSSTEDTNPPLGEDQEAILQARIAALHPLLQILAREDVVSAPRMHNIHRQVIQIASENGASSVLFELRRLLLQQKLVSPDRLQEALAELYGLEFHSSLDDAELLPEFIHGIPIHYARKFMLFPLHLREESLWVAVEDPELTAPIEDIGRLFSRPVKTVVSTRQAILSLIDRAYDRSRLSAEQVIETLDNQDGAKSLDWALEEPEDLIDAQDEEPIKRLLNTLFYQAAKGNASDVHVDCTANEVVIRFRVDGSLRTAVTLPKSVQRTFINRIKIMSRLDIAQHGLPQDGRTLVLIAGRRIDIRVSIMPTVHGEKAVMRMLYQDHGSFRLRLLGMPQSIYEEMRVLVRLTGGIILVSGPTGSGKTTTLYALLSEIDRQRYNIITIEDPVEYKIAGYVQTEVNPRVGLTFASALRSVLRQDPDVIMVGEMRDRETALIAAQSALTGHTVFSTVHTNSASATITRLVDMGIEAYLVSSTVHAVLAQRLVRRICIHCRTETPANPTLMKDLGWKKIPSQVYHGSGCPECGGTGFLGRIGLFELLRMSPAIKNSLLKSPDANSIRAIAAKEGMESMLDWGRRLVEEGTTTPDELMHLHRED